MAKKVGKYVGSDSNAAVLQLKETLDVDYVDITFLDTFFAVSNEGYCTEAEASQAATDYINEVGFDNLSDKEKAYYAENIA